MDFYNAAEEEESDELLRGEGKSDLGFSFLSLRPSSLLSLRWRALTSTGMLFEISDALRKNSFKKYLKALVMLFRIFKWQASESGVIQHWNRTIRGKNLFYDLP
ncbi:hypothetical protein CEXT_465791 [Caerostris extrusa]|uniref:Uncharacterized protein n=1 Tax=Caerostris extrusa TaxID=172846 RepID=A0AAV4PSM2_CAEEX|nr:hypothetical protein CEXT_465791 [Caerostris extrusa]